MSDSTPTPRGPLLLLSALGVVSGAWAGFLWWQLLRARAGFDPVCLGGDDGGCGALWDGAFASAIHAGTGLPVAAWGVVWSVAAAALPLRALGRPTDRSATLAVGWTGVAGLLGILGLLAVSYLEGGFCGSCAVTYVVTLIYGFLALYSLGKPDLSGGLATFVLASGAAWLILLFPGLRTPKNLQNAGQEALQIQRSTDQDSEDDGHGHGHDHDHDHVGEMPTNLDQHPLSVKSWPLEPEEQTARLTAFVSDLDPQVKSALVELLGRYRAAPYFPAPAARAPHGAASATTRITDFTDTQCGHCAQLFVSLYFLRGLFPENAVSVDSRHFPLDGNCNPNLEIQGPEQVRCMAARARICMEQHREREAYEEQLYRNQEGLTQEQVFELAAPFTDRTDLEQCIGSPDTANKLTQDINQAWLYRPTGTPLVLVNGRQANPFGPFLYLLILSGGNPDHPVLQELVQGA